MRIFFFSTVFAPKVGGIERMTEMLCDEFTAMRHEVRLATLTPGGGDRHRAYPVIRQPTLIDFLRQLRWCDIHLQANVSLIYAFARLLRPRRLIYRHANVYQRDDGTLTIRDRLKRLIARRTRGIANSRYTAAKLNCAHIVLNAYDDVTFAVTTPWEARKQDLVFLGRLVSQKGCDVLLRALGRLAKEGLTPTLTVIGDGPDREMLEKLARAERIYDQVRFTGCLQGPELAAELNRHRVMVVPSRYEEPFGIVALEGLACGCVPIVSERGGLVDAIGTYGFTFPNGDDAALAERLRAVIQDLGATRSIVEDALQHLHGFRAETVAERYIAIFETMLRGRPPICQLPSDGRPVAS